MKRPKSSDCFDVSTTMPYFLYGKHQREADTCYLSIDHTANSIITEYINDVDE